MELNNKKLANILKKLIQFKSGTTKVPVRAESWEELIWATLVFMFGKNKVNWDPQSHEKSVDIKAKINGDIIKISAKAGEIKHNKLAISSYRLTSFDNLEDKLKFIKKQHEHFDFYLICAREIQKNIIIYSIVKTPAKKLAPTWLINQKNWQKNKNYYQLKNIFAFEAKIVFKMSNQLWYDIPRDYFSKKEIMAKVSIPIKSLGTGLIEFLEKNFKT